MKAFFVYMMSNQSRVVLYTGVTNDLERRVSEHQHGAVTGFTKRYRCNRLVYYEDFPDITAAIAREKQIKGWTRAKKNVLVESINRDWTDLSRTLFDPVGGPSPSARLRMTEQSANAPSEERAS
ncbi:MAG: GIY-YIG nuclease family protein [Chthoniobacterales bacterium]